MRDDIFTPFNCKPTPMEMDPDSLAVIAEELNGFLEENDVPEMLEMSDYVQATYEADKFRGPLFNITNMVTEDDVFQVIHLGKAIKHAFLRRNSDGSVDFLEHNFDKGYRNALPDWFRGIYKGIQVAKERDSLKWKASSK